MGSERRMKRQKWSQEKWDDKKWPKESATIIVFYKTQRPVFSWSLDVAVILTKTRYVIILSLPGVETVQVSSPNLPMIQVQLQSRSSTPIAHLLYSESKIYSFTAQRSGCQTVNWQIDNCTKNLQVFKFNLLHHKLPNGIWPTAPKWRT